MSSKKQTAVEWLVNELNQKIDFIPMDKWDMIRDIVQQAKAMEKEQIQDAFYCGIEVDESKVHSPYRAAEDYFKQNY
jgi:3-mercaptopyruvate sulfurtransferase SseA